MEQNNGSASQEPKRKVDDTLLMQVTKQGGFGNTAIVGTVTIRMAATLVLAILGAVLLWQTSLFESNWIALIAYAAFANIVLGHTPTGRNLLTNLYGIVFKKPANMLVTEEMTTTTFGHGISNVDVTDPNVDTVPFRLSATKMVALVYNITSGIGYWSTEEEKVTQARNVKSLYNILEGGESLMIVEKQDNDTGMLKLREYLESQETYEGDDLAQMAKKTQPAPLQCRHHPGRPEHSAVRHPLREVQEHQPDGKRFKEDLPDYPPGHQPGGCGPLRDGI